MSAVAAPTWADALNATSYYLSNNTASNMKILAQSYSARALIINFKGKWVKSKRTKRSNKNDHGTLQGRFPFRGFPASRAEVPHALAKYGVLRTYVGIDGCLFYDGKYSC